MHYVEYKGKKYYIAKDHEGSLGYVKERNSIRILNFQI